MTCDRVFRPNVRVLFLVSCSLASFERGINTRTIVDAAADSCKLTLDRTSSSLCA